MSDESGGPQVASISEAEFHALVGRANAGDAEALVQLRRVLDAEPEIAARVGNLALHAEQLLIGLISDGNQLLAESLARQLRDMKAELAGSTPSLLERMAVDRVIATWLQLQHADSLTACPGAARLPQGHFMLKWQRQANAGYLAAVKTLTELRRLPASKSASHAQPERDRPLQIFSGEPADEGAAVPPRPTGTDNM